MRESTMGRGKPTINEYSERYTVFLMMTQKKEPKHVGVLGF
jgi:hypothetical protein